MRKQHTNHSSFSNSQLLQLRLVHLVRLKAKPGSPCSGQAPPHQPRSDLDISATSPLPASALFSCPLPPASSSGADCATCCISLTGAGSRAGGPRGRLLKAPLSMRNGVRNHHHHSHVLPWLPRRGPCPTPLEPTVLLKLPLNLSLRDRHLYAFIHCKYIEIQLLVTVQSASLSFCKDKFF